MPVTFSDVQFRALRQAILKRRYPVDVDKEKRSLKIYSEGLSDSEKLLMPQRVKEAIIKVQRREK